MSITPLEAYRDLPQKKNEISLQLLLILKDMGVGDLEKSSVIACQEELLELGWAYIDSKARFDTYCTLRHTISTFISGKEKGKDFQEMKRLNNQLLELYHKSFTEFRDRYLECLQRNFRKRIKKEDIQIRIEELRLLKHKHSAESLSLILSKFK